MWSMAGRASEERLRDPPGSQTRVAALSVAVPGGGQGAAAGGQCVVWYYAQYPRGIPEAASF